MLPRFTTEECNLRVNRSVQDGQFTEPPAMKGPERAEFAFAQRAAQFLLGLLAQQLERKLPLWFRQRAAAANPVSFFIGAAAQSGQPVAACRITPQSVSSVPRRIFKGLDIHLPPIPGRDQESCQNLVIIS